MYLRMTLIGLISNGQYSGQNSLFFPHPEKGGNLFLPCFSRHFYGDIFRLMLFSEKICARTFQVSKFEQKRVFNARSAKFFQILPYKLLKIHEKGKKVLNNCKKYYQGRAYFFPVSLFISKSLFLPPPPGGGGCGRNIYRCLL